MGDRKVFMQKVMYIILTMISLVAVFAEGKLYIATNSLTILFSLLLIIIYFTNLYLITTNEKYKYKRCSEEKEFNSMFPILFAITTAMVGHWFISIILIIEIAAYKAALEFR